MYDWKTKERTDQIPGRMSAGLDIGACPIAPGKYNL